MLANSLLILVSYRHKHVQRQQTKRTRSFNFLFYNISMKISINEDFSSTRAYRFFLFLSSPSEELIHVKVERVREPSFRPNVSRPKTRRFIPERQRFQRREEFRSVELVRIPRKNSPQKGWVRARGLMMRKGGGKKCGWATSLDR